MSDVQNPNNEGLQNSWFNTVRTKLKPAGDIVEAFMGKLDATCRVRAERFNNAVAGYVSCDLTRAPFFEKVKPYITQLPEGMQHHITKATAADAMKAALMTFVYFQVLRMAPKDDLMALAWNGAALGGAALISCAHDFSPHLWEKKELHKQGHKDATLRLLKSRSMVSHDVELEKEAVDLSSVMWDKKTETVEVAKSDGSGTESKDITVRTLTKDVQDEIIHDAFKGLQYFAMARLLLSTYAAVSIFHKIEKAGLFYTLVGSAVHLGVAGTCFVFLKRAADISNQYYVNKAARNSIKA
jgi:hypothetical protein